MLFLDYNSSIRDIFKQVEGVSQHGLDELFDEEVIAGNKSYSEVIISAGLASREDILVLLLSILAMSFRLEKSMKLTLRLFHQLSPIWPVSTVLFPLYLSEGGIHFLLVIHLIQQSLMT
jgi:hypothetical protein